MPTPQLLVSIGIVTVGAVGGLLLARRLMSAAPLTARRTRKRLEGAGNIAGVGLLILSVAFSVGDEEEPLWGKPWRRRARSNRQQLRSLTIQS